MTGVAEDFAPEIAAELYRIEFVRAAKASEEGTFVSGLDRIDWECGISVDCI